MPANNKMNEVIAYGVGDIHLTLKTPACRTEDDWLAVQASYLRQLKARAGSMPIFCSGDIFDRWDAKSELVEFALRELPDNMYCVPGQHDLPNHRIDLMRKSGYGVLKAAGKIIDLTTHKNVAFGSDWEAVGIGWDQELAVPPDWQDLDLLLVCHRYVWDGGNKYPDAPTEASVKALTKYLQHYKAAIFGDNHKGFLTQSGKCSVFNNGSFIRRKADEIEYAPQIGALTQGGVWLPVKLNTFQDDFLPEAKDRPETPFDMRDFVAELNWLGDEGFDFREVVSKHLRRDKNIAKQTKQIILEALDGSPD